MKAMKIRWIFAAVAVAFLASPAPAQGNGGDRAPRGKKARELAARKVITNEILADLYGAAPSPAPESFASEEPAGEVKLPDPLREMHEEMARKADARRSLHQVGQEIQELERTLKDLEARKLAVLNPYLPPPRLTEEEAAEWKGLDNVERLKRTEEQIRQVRIQLQAARKAYRAASRRAG